MMGFTEFCMPQGHPTGAARPWTQGKNLRNKKFGSGTPDPETGFAFAYVHQDVDGQAGRVDWQRRGGRTERKCGWYQDAPPVNFVLFVDLP
jgi:hypothetical protein